MDDGILDGKIIIEKIGRLAVIGEDAADCGGGQHHGLQGGGLHPCRHRPRVTQIQRFTAHGKDR